LERERDRQTRIKRRLARAQARKKLRQLPKKPKIKSPPGTPERTGVIERPKEAPVSSGETVKPSDERQKQIEDTWAEKEKAEERRKRAETEEMWAKHRSQYLGGGNGR